MNAVYDALKAGRTAIVNMDYSERDAQGLIARELISKILGVKSSNYLRGGSSELGNANPDMAEVIHDLSVFIIHLHENVDNYHLLLLHIPIFHSISPHALLLLLLLLLCYCYCCCWSFAAVTFVMLISSFSFTFYFCCEKNTFFFSVFYFIEN